MTSILLRRPAVHTETLVACAAIFMLASGNGPFWRAALANRPLTEPGTWVFAGAVFAALACFYFALIALVSARRTVRPLLALLLVATALASYYMDHYAVYLDRTMMANVVATNPNEARELVGFGLIAHIVVWGVLPAAVLWWPELKTRPWRRAVVVRIACVVGGLVLGVASLLSVFADAASMTRNHREMRWLITPANALVAMAQNAADNGVDGGPKAPIATDAKVAASNRTRPILFVLVVGETARAQEFSLNGYSRDTNPQLARRNVINFPHATSCGTSTEVSLPCMFSQEGRAHYDESRIQSHQSVLQVLARVGVNVRWRDNQSGCKGVCDGLQFEQFNALDEVLLQGMDGIVAIPKGDTLVVMHQLGSHGPSYFKRYPPAFERFVPTCDSDDLRMCDSAAIVNAYDNTILYTDHVLGGVIDFLDAAQKTHDTAMLYVSDHGESLGENGLYLHGVPYAIAPDVQKHVPFVLWISKSLETSARIDDACMHSRSQQPASHDNLFHTLLGIFSVTTAAYDPALDLFAGCRTMRSN